VNPAFSEITGYSYEEAIDKNPNFLSSGEHSSQFYDDMWKQIKQQGYWQGEIRNRKKNGEHYLELLNLSSILGQDGITLNYLGLFSDITQIKDQQEKLELMAHYDVLTKLPNRILLGDRFTQAVAYNKRNQSLLAICFLDLDGFKHVNDTYGHEIGDKLLIEVAKRIASCIREEDTISRLGGDEFALLLGGIESVLYSEGILKRIHQSLSQPYLINKQTLNISASSGLAFYPIDESTADAGFDVLLRHADQAMYQAKLAGRNGFRIYNESDDKKIAQLHSQLNEIQHALVNNEFQLFYQPKVNIKTGKVFGVEALIRWLHPEKGLIPPLDFLPLIDGSELECQIGDWVIDNALNQLNLWHNQEHKLEVSVNISSAHLQSPSFFTQLEQALAKHPQVDSKYIQLEILESSALSDLQYIIDIIKTCQTKLGVRVALDDFGTGYSSLTHLRNISANMIKIDQTFVRDILDDPNDFTIIEGVIGLSDSFGREVIAEGVETTEHG